MPEAIFATIPIGLIAAFFTTFAFVPQSIKILRGGDVSGISVSMYLMFVVGVVLWILYGISKADFAVILANVMTLAFALPILIKVVLRRRSIDSNGDKKTAVREQGGSSR